MSARAHADEVEAQRAQSRQALLRLINKGAWDGAERAFAALEDLGGMTAEDLTLGAHAAWNRGDIAVARSRIEQALRLERDAELLVWLRSIDAGYAPIDIREGSTLTPADPPMAIDARQSIAIAQAALDEDGAFEGLLPVGDYQLDGARFSLSTEVPALVQPTPPSPASVPASSTAHRPSTPTARPTFSAGPGFTAVGAPRTDAPQPASFSGLGARLSAGLERPVGRVIGLGGLSYHSTFGTTGSTLQLLSGGLGVGWHPWRLRLSAAGEASIGVLSAVGIHDLDTLNADCPAGSTEADCAWITGIDEANREGYRWSGIIAAPGARLSAGAALFTLPGDHEGRLMLSGGALLDPARAYPWAQVALQVGPVW